MSDSNPKKNFIYNVIYQILVLVIPLITSPYLSRVIGATGVGIYSYTYSIVYYFMLLTLLGVNNYGNRTVAKVRDDKEKLSKTFWSIYMLQLIMGIIMLILYFCYVLMFGNNYKIVAIIQGLYIISAILDINWFFFGLERFKETITRNSIVKIGSALLIFICIKSENDLWKYTLILSGMTCLSQIIMWGFLKNKIKFVKIEYKDIVQHIKSNLILFIPVIAVSLYKIMDKIMLGYITDVTEVGYYENADKIIHIPLTLIIAMGTVMLPRMSHIIANEDKEKAKEYIQKSIVFVMFMSVAMCFGLIAIGYNFAPMFFGDKFQKTGILIMLLATTIPFYSFANVLRTQYLIPCEKDKIYIKSVFLGAISNFIMNIVFIPKYGSVGACFGTMVAEFSVMLYQAMAIRKDVPVKEYIKNSMPFLLKAIIMLLVIYPLNFIDINSFLRLICQIGIGCIVYGLLNIKYILSIIDLKKFLNKIRKFIKRKDEF